jgi:hypothetical protein
MLGQKHVEIRAAEAWEGYEHCILVDHLDELLALPTEEEGELIATPFSTCIS